MESLNWFRRAETRFQLRGKTYCTQPGRHGYNHPTDRFQFRHSCYGFLSESPEDSDHDGCPTDDESIVYFRIPETDVCIHLGTGRKTWAKAFEACLEIGANLLTVFSAEEQQAIVNWMRNPCETCSPFLLSR